MTTTDAIRSPLGDHREHSVPCNLCWRPTWNYQAVCDPCIEVAR